jgi:hypothetical protein
MEMTKAVAQCTRLPRDIGRLNNDERGRQWSSARRISHQAVYFLTRR